MKQMNVEINKELFEHFVPSFANSEEYVFEKVNAYIAMAELELNELVGDDSDTYFKECPQLMENVQNYICTEAAYRAIPQMDLVLTANGFGVVNTSNVAPASKDRVAALLEELRVHSSDIMDVIVMFLLKYTSWKETEQAKRKVSALLYSPMQFRGHWQWQGKAIYREELARLRPKVELAAAEVRKIISKELYDELLVRLRTGKNEAAYELTASRATNYMFAFLDDQPLKEFRRILIDTVESLAETLPEYQHSSVFRARHAEGYQNRKEDAVFFMS